MTAEQLDEIMKESGITAREIGVDKYDDLTAFYTSDNLRSLRQRKQAEMAEGLYRREQDTASDWPY